MPAWVVSTTAIGVYLLATLVIGWLANRRLTGDAEDFLVYGRAAGPFVLYLAVVSTYHSAFAFLGSSGFFYTHGIGFWMAGCWTVLVGAITMTYGTRIWALGKRFGYVTPAELVADFFGSETLRVLVALVSMVFTLLYIQVQAQGLGYILSAATGDRVSVAAGSALLLAVAAAYLMVGGLRAVYWTDVLQGLWMYIGVWAGATVLVVELFGSPAAMWERLVVERPDLLTLPGPRGFFTPGMWVGMTVVLSFGVVFQPHMLIRYFSAASDRTLKLLGATTPIYLASLYIPTAFVGLGGALAMPGLEVPDRVFPLLLLKYAPAWLTGLVLAGATAAAMSTLDAILHSNMTVLTRDVYQRFINPEADERRVVAVGRALVVVLLVLGFWLAVTSSKLLVTVIVMSGAGALQLMPAITNICFPRQRSLSRIGVIAGLLAGLAVLYLTSVPYRDPLGIHGGLWALAANWLLAALLSRFTPPPDEARVQRIWGAVEDFVYGEQSPDSDSGAAE